MADNYIERYARRKTTSSAPIMIEVQINGARTRAANPHIPVTHREIADEVLAVSAAGASIIHAHNTDFMLHGEDAYDDYMKSWDVILAVRPDLLWYCTTTIDEDRTRMGLEHAQLLIQRAGMRMGCVDPGAANVAHGQDENGNLRGRTYMWTLDQISRQIAMYRRHDAGIVLGIYEP
ncbi:MAG TPA: 3-keto-5-aminohexanoate cleavage protein, partial [Pseudoduganella sp.]